MQTPAPSAPKKRGAKPGVKRPVYTEAEDRKIKTVPAQNLGMSRDPLVAALFG